MRIISLINAKKSCYFASLLVFTLQFIYVVFCDLDTLKVTVIVEFDLQLLLLL